MGFFGKSLAIVAIVMAMVGNAKAADYIARDHLVIDLRFGLEWLRCSVGQVWNGEDCEGEIVHLNHDQISLAITMANEQLGGKWRLPNREELEGLVCRDCERPVINAKYFPGTSPEPYWTGQYNGFASRHIWSVNFFTGDTYGRFFPYQGLAVRLVRDRR